MATSPTFSPKKALISAINLLVFTLLDLLDVVLCYVYRFIDGILEGDPVHCYCGNRGEQEGGGGAEEEEEVSETLHGRKNVFREIGLGKTEPRRDEKFTWRPPRWSDCGCRGCISWQGKAEEEEEEEDGGKEKLHLVVKEPSQAGADSTENVMFLHGFLSSSAWWTQTVFPNISAHANDKLRMLAADLLGFGRSPKPTQCLYTLKDHVEMIEKSAVIPFRLKSYHIVAHSMGCVIALALAAKHPESVKSITLVAPPYIDSSKTEASFTALSKLAEKRIWPPLSFGTSVMSWYEHIGRTVCFLFCRHHLAWEPVLRLLLSPRRDLDFLLTDMTKHTHHSAWHTMHNVICGGARLLDRYLDVIRRAGVSVRIIHGDKDQVVPVGCSYDMKSQLPLAELEVIADADHCSVIIGREKIFTSDLEGVWSSTSKATCCH